MRAATRSACAVAYRLGEGAGSAQVVGERLTMTLGRFLGLRECGRDVQMEAACI